MEISNMYDDMEKEILKQLEKMKKVVLLGKAGVGKTWMARKVSDSALKKSFSYGTIWINAADCHDDDTLTESIASQLSVLFSCDDEWDDNDDDDKCHKKPKPEYALEKPLKEQILRKLKLIMNPEKQVNKYLLVVLDDVSETENDEDLVKKAEALLSPGKQNHLKILITSRKENVELASQEISSDDTFMQVVPGANVESLKSLLDERVESSIKGNQKFEELSRIIAEKCSGLPAIVVMVAAVFNRALKKHDKNVAQETEPDDETQRNWELEFALKDAADVKGGENGMLRFVYEAMLPNEVICSCFWLAMELFQSGSSIHYNELITYWILEGCFAHHDRVEDAYMEGHSVLMDFKGRGFLKVERNYVRVEQALLNLKDDRQNGFSGNMMLGLAKVLSRIKRDGFKRVLVGDGMIQTVYTKKQNKNETISIVSGLVIEGSCLSRVNLDKFFEPLTELQMLVILNPSFEEVPQILTKLEHLQVLILRGCKFLKKLGGVQSLTNLLALEVSGCSAMKSIDVNTFERMKKLELLNLSGAGVMSVPAFHPKLNEQQKTSVPKRNQQQKIDCVLRVLILRDCQKLIELPSLTFVVALEMLDLCGCIELEKLRDQKLHSLTKLHTLNQSRTKIRGLPYFGTHHPLLTRILASDCDTFNEMTILNSVQNLLVLDVSGAKDLKNISKAKLTEKSCLKILDVSKSGLPSFPINILNISHLHMRESVITELPSTDGCPNLEYLDLSGSVSLEELKDKSFDHLKNLRHLDFSDIKIKCLPSLSPLVQLRKLILKNFHGLSELLNLNELVKLEVLDLSGCDNLTIAQDGLFRTMLRLKKLDMSKTKIESLPRDCFPANLCHLVMRDCKLLKQLPSLESLSSLEELDLSGCNSLSGNIDSNFLQSLTNLEILNLSEVVLEAVELSLSHLSKLRQLSLKGSHCVVRGLASLKEIELMDLSETKTESSLSLAPFSKLQELQLENCSNLQVLENLGTVTKLQVLNLSGTKIKEFPYEAAELTSLRLRDMKDLAAIDWTKIKQIPEVFDIDDSHIVTVPSRITVQGTNFFKSLSKLLDANPLQQFHFSVWLPPKKQIDHMSLLRYIDPRAKFSSLKEIGAGLLEIHGSCNLPGDMEQVLKYAQHVSLIDNSKITLLSEAELIRSSVSMKSCCLERCPNLHTVFSSTDDARLTDKLSALYLCNLPALIGIGGVLTNLTNLYVDCCLEMKSLLPLSKLPPNLETLTVKFGGVKLEKLFEVDNSGSCEMQKLHTLELLDLPKLKTTGVLMPALRKLRIRGCPFLGENLEEIVEKTKLLDTLCVSGVVFLKSLRNSSPRYIKTLKIESCHELTDVFSSSQLPESLSTIEIKLCDKVAAVFGPSSSEGGLLTSVCLWKLPLLEKIGFSVRDGYVVRECPKLRSIRSAQRSGSRGVPNSQAVTQRPTTAQRFVQAIGISRCLQTPDQ